MSKLVFTRIASIVALVAIIVSVAHTDASACGPNFPVALLSQRPTTMSQLPEGIFTEEVRHLVPPPAHRYLVSEGVEPVNARAGGSVAERSLYDRGSAAFHEGNPAAAIEAFETLLALPADQRQYRSTWAAFMLGRLRHGAASIASYQLVRMLQANGFRDDLGLAAASLRQEAARHGVAGNRPLELARFAELAAHGSKRGALALLFLARNAVSDGALASLTSDRIGQKLLGAYLYTRRNEISDEQMMMVLEALAESGTFSGGARLAAAAYREGKWNLAHRLAALDSDDALGKWVLAKLALRRGDRAQAELLMQQVNELSTGEGGLCDSQSRSRVAIESTILALRAGHPLKAMKHAWDAREHYDGALFIAERVLSVDELAIFLRETPNLQASQESAAWGSVTEDSLRSLMARRMMREGHSALRLGLGYLARQRFNEAQSYFDDQQGESAMSLAKWLLRAFSTRDSIERADALYRASRIAREQGLEILGTSQAPDWEIYGATLAPGAYLSTESSEWLSDEEGRRVATSAPIFSERFHYRSLASALAVEAANSLPHQSQAFAAVLCHATRYVFNTDRERVASLWTRYINEGPAVDFAPTFGVECPEPEFIAARRYLLRSKSPWMAFFLALLSLNIALGVSLFFVRRRSIQRERLGQLGA